jgi:enhancing lycopene biosynthesis protein 2
MCCIAPVIAAKLLPGCKLTVGKDDKGKNWPYAGTIQSVRLLGSEVVEKDVNEIEVDKNYKLVTTPAYMKNASFYEVFEGIGKMIDNLIKLTN